MIRTEIDLVDHRRRIASAKIVSPPPPVDRHQQPGPSLSWDSLPSFNAASIRSLCST